MPVLILKKKKKASCVFLSYGCALFFCLCVYHASGLKAFSHPSLYKFFPAELGTQKNGLLGGITTKTNPKQLLHNMLKHSGTYLALFGWFFGKIYTDAIDRFTLFQLFWQ